MNIKPVKKNEVLIAKGMVDGDRKSYVEFVERFSPHIYRECLKYSNDSDEADDHLNEILIRIVISIGRFDPGGAYSGESCHPFRVLPATFKSLTIPVTITNQVAGNFQNYFSS